MTRFCAFVLLTTLTGSFVACKTSDTSSAKRVDDIAATTNSDGVFTVVCKDGKTTKYSVEQYRQAVTNDSVCGGSAVSTLMCVAYDADTSRIAPISKPNSYFGTNVPHSDCQNAIRASRENLVCAPYNSTTSQLFKISIQNPFGANIAHADCNNLVMNAHDGLVCEPYDSTTSQLLDLSAQSTTGTNVDHKICARLVAAATHDLWCVPYNSTTSQIHRRANNDSIGTNVPHEQCIANIRPQ